MILDEFTFDDSVDLFVFHCFCSSCSDESRYLSSLEESGWLRQIEILLDYAICIAAKLSKDGTSVLLSVGSGFERVAQVCFLYMLLC